MEAFRQRRSSPEKLDWQSMLGRLELHLHVFGQGFCTYYFTGGVVHDAMGDEVAGAPPVLISCNLMFLFLLSCYQVYSRTCVHTGEQTCVQEPDMKGHGTCSFDCGI